MAKKAPDFKVAMVVFDNILTGLYCMKKKLDFKFKNGDVLDLLFLEMLCTK